MFIKCEKCGAIFNIDASLIKPGQRLRCSGCNYIFKYEPVQEGQKKEPAPLQTEAPRIVVQSPVEQESLSNAVNAPQFDRAPAVEKHPNRPFARLILFLRNNRQIKARRYSINRPTKSFMMKRKKTHKMPKVHQTISLPFPFRRNSNPWRMLRNPSRFCGFY